MSDQSRPFQRCSISVMDTIADPDITFDHEGVCHYYHLYKIAESAQLPADYQRDSWLNAVLDEIKKSGAGKRYDCIAGISGGTDSTYVALQAKKLGLRPLFVHFDNGWNSELAVSNIEKVLSGLDFDLYTLVVDWTEFRDMQLAYLKSSVVDIEVLTDHAIGGTLYRMAHKHGIKHILSGNNIVSEFVLPPHWVFNKADDLNIRDILHHHGTVPNKTYPFLSRRRRQYYQTVSGIKTVELLNLLPYNPLKAKEEIKTELGWQDYGGKHYESIFTRFYQGYILPQKFGIDKRKAHLSNLIFSGMITREQALEELSKPSYDQQQYEQDRVFVLKKLNLTDEEFDNLMSLPRVEHRAFKHQKQLLDQYPSLKLLRPLWRKIKRK